MITDIRLQNFRSYKDSSFDIDSGVNIIIGPNGSGKTNLLESIMMICVGSSYRSKDQNLINIGSNWSKIEAHNQNQLRELKLTFNKDNKLAKKFKINSYEFSRLKLDQTIPIVLFEPNHLQLLSGSPDIRRDYLDTIIGQTKPGYKQLINKYKRLVTQRNHLLKNPPVDSHSIFAFNVQLSEIGGKIFRSRQELITQINKNITEIYREISKNNEKIELNYLSKINTDNYETKLLKALEDFNQDIIRGHTLHGPHRDDFKIFINSHEFNNIASRGETRTIILSLKLIEAKIIEDNISRVPVLLLDDVFGELDQRRRKILTSKIKNYQTFITTTDADIIIKNFNKSVNIIISQNN